MADYVVRLNGEDNLSSTIRQVKKEMTDFGKSAENVDVIDKKFQKIINSSAPLKRQLRDLQALMAKMQMDGIKSTDERFTKIAIEAGKIKDAINDAATATNRFSSDTMGLDAAIQGLQGVTAVAGVATSAMALFGNENQDVAKAIMKLQAALTMMNGVQQLSNILNKDSVLM